MLKGIKLLLVVMSVLIGSPVLAQNKILDKTKQFYNYLNAGDSTLLKSMFYSHGSVTHVGSDTVFAFSVNEFMNVCPSFKAGMFHEKIYSINSTEISPEIRTIEIGFDFYLNGKFSHCGVDYFIWIETDGEFRIESILSSNGIECEEGFVYPEIIAPKIEDELNVLVDKWHQDVVNLKFEDYFDFMASDFYFLGTDPSERWSKSEFKYFCEPFFLEKKSTWNFKPIERNWDVSQDGNIAWFDESLDTWMLDARGSGVLEKVNGQWKVAHYNLTVLIENEKMDGFLELRRK